MSFRFAGFVTRLVFCRGNTEHETCPGGLRRAHAQHTRGNGVSICRPLNGDKRAADSHDAALLGLRGEDAPLSATHSVHREPDSSTVTMTTVLIVTHGVTQSRPDAARWASGWDSPHAG